MICFHLLSLIAFLPSGLSQESQNVDSVLHTLALMKNDSVKVQHLISLYLDRTRYADYTAATRYAQEVLALSTTLNYYPGKMNAYYFLGYVYSQTGDYEASLSNYKLSAGIAETMGNRWGVADINNGIGLLQKFLGNYKEALHHYEIALAIYEEEDIWSGIGNVNVNIGVAYYHLGEIAKALDYYARGTKAFEVIRDTSGIASSLGNQASIYQDQGNFSKAMEMHLASLEMFKALGKIRSMAICYNNIGLIYGLKGNYPEAMKYHLLALKLREQASDKSGICTSYDNIGNLLSLQGHKDDALHYYQLSLALQQELGDKYGISNSYTNIGNIQFDQGHYAEALKNYTQCHELKKEIEDKAGIASSHGNIGNVYYKQGHYPNALDHYLESLNLFTELGDKVNLANNYLSLGQVYTKLNHYPEAKKYLDDALSLSKEIGVKTNIPEIYEAYALLDSCQGYYLNAMENYKMYTKHKDSLMNETNSKVLAEMTINYETEKKDKEIKALESDQEINSLQLKIQQESLSHMRSENERIQVANLFHMQKAELNDNKNKVQELEIAKSKAGLMAQQAEMKSKENELVLLNKESEIHKLKLKKQTMLKNYLLAGLVALGLLSFFVYHYYLTRQKLKLQTLRNKIASDLHDDVGSTLSSIYIFSEMAQQQSKEVIPLLNTIGESSRKMLDAMADIVWTINPENDQFEKIILRMRNFAFDLLGAKQIDFEFKADAEIAKYKLPMEVRKNLYLIFKEATNNIVKYADADRAMFSLKAEKDHLTMLIRDNGKGFDLSQSTEGNGLKNMKKRATEIGANLSIDSIPGTGTTIQLRIAV